MPVQNTQGDIKENVPSAAIILMSPIKGAVYSLTDSITISGTTISTQIIHGYDIAIAWTNDTTTYFFQHIHDDNDTLVINKKWKGELKTGTNIEAVVTSI